MWPVTADSDDGCVAASARGDDVGGSDKENSATPYAPPPRVGDKAVRTALHTAQAALSTPLPSLPAHDGLGTRDFVDKNEGLEQQARTAKRTIGDIQQRLRQAASRNWAAESARRRNHPPYVDMG